MRALAANVPRIAEGWRTAAGWLGLYGGQLLSMTGVPPEEAPPPQQSEGTGREAPSSGEVKVSISGVGDPTGARAVAVVDRTAAFLSDRQALECEIHAAEAAISAVVSRVSKMKRAYLAKPKTSAPVDENEQCTHCGDPRDRGRGDSCNPCYMWRRRNLHGDGSMPSTVPTHVIARRQAVRENRKVHVTGPLVDEVLV